MLQVKNQDKDENTAAEPADTMVASGMVPSLLTFQMDSQGFCLTEDRLTHAPVLPIDQTNIPVRPPVKRAEQIVLPYRWRAQLNKDTARGQDNTRYDTWKASDDDMDHSLPTRNSEARPASRCVW